MTTETYSLQVEHVIAGPAEAVFDAWLDPASLQKWMTPGPGMSVPTARVDARVGGRFHIVMRAGGRDIAHDGEYRVIDRPHKLVFTWISDPAGNSLVTIEFHRMSDRSTRVVLTHDRLLTEASRDGHRMGWAGILGALDHAVTHGAGA